ncbi:MAG: hypothetical protein H6592_14875 [Flavobacteriales bacterium]|nr:hypothetical protein [Flavobacteriales bacterium]
MLVAQIELTEDLFKVRILSEKGRQMTFQWIRSLENLSPEFRGLHLTEIVPTPLRGDLSSAGRAFNKLQTYRYLSDSLVNSGALPGPLDRSRKDQARRSEALWSIQNGNSLPRASTLISTNSTGLAYAAVDSAFANELAELRYFMSKVDTSVFVRYGRPQDLAEELYTLNVVDSLFVVEVSRRVECGQIMNAAGVLEHIRQSEDDRAWAIQEREKRLALINALVLSGSLSAADAGRIAGTDPYYIPDRFDVAIASSPHAIIDCTGPARSLDEYYRSVLNSVRDVVPELHPTDVRTTLTPLDTTFSRATHLFECTFTNAGYNYSFTEYDGHRAMSRQDTTRRSCYGPLSCISALNKALSDLRSPYRLKYFEKQKGSCGIFSLDQQGLAFLDEERCSIWWPIDERSTDALGLAPTRSSFSRCAELFSMEFSRDSIRSMFDTLQSRGLLEHVDQWSLEKAIQLANESTRHHWDEALRYIPSFTAYPAIPRFPEKNGLIALRLKELELISHGTVSITEVKEKWRRRKYDRWEIRLDFKVNGRPTRIDRSILTVGLEDEIITRINHALMKAKTHGRFVSIDSERDVAVIFVDRRQYDTLQAELITPWYSNPWNPDTEIFDRRY